MGSNLSLEELEHLQVCCWQLVFEDVIHRCNHQLSGLLRRQAEIPYLFQGQQELQSLFLTLQRQYTKTLSL